MLSFLPSTLWDHPKNDQRKEGSGRSVIYDDVEAADGIAIRSVIRETDNGPVEETWEEPIWLNRPESMPSVITIHVHRSMIEMAF